MSREIVISETDKIAVVLENGIVNEFFLSEGDQFVGDIIFATVESIVPAIEAAFLNIGREKSGFIHVSDLPSSRKQQSGIRQFLKPQQPLLVQVTREPTGNKGACLTGYIQLPGRFLVLTPFERRIGLSKRIYDARERARLARIARIICGSGYGIVLRPEAIGQSEQALRDDLKLLLGRWKSILATSEKQTPGTTLYRDQDILERILREGSTHSVARIIMDDQTTYDRAIKYFDHWSDTRTRSKLRLYKGEVPVMSYYGVFRQLEAAIQPLVHLPSGGTLVIQPTEALTSIDINTSSMTSADSQPETILRTNVEAAEEIARQLILRDIGGVIVIDFIDMDNPRDQQIVWTKLSNALHGDKAQPQISYFSEFGLVEMTRRRQRQRLSEMLTMDCPSCQGIGRIRNMMYRADILTGEGMKSRLPSFLSTPEEKSTRYKGGVEKTKEKSSSSSSKSRRSQKSSGASQPAKQEAPTRSAPPPTPPPAPAKKKEKLTENPKDLLFDEGYFTDPIDDAFLDQFIEREDKLNVSKKLAEDLDKLLDDIEANGIDSLLPDVSEASEDEDAEQEADSSADDAETNTAADADSHDDAETSEDDSEDDTEEEDKKSSKKNAKTAKKTKKSVKTKASKAKDDSDEDAEAKDSDEDASDDVEASPDSADDTDEAQKSSDDSDDADDAPSEEDEAVVEEKPAKKKTTKKTAAKKTTKKTAAKKSKKAESDEATDEESGAAEDKADDKKTAAKADKSDKADEEADSDEKADETSDAPAVDEDEALESEATEDDAEKTKDAKKETKASVSEPNKTTRRRVVKKLLTKRRSIRSFRPKK